MYQATTDLLAPGIDKLIASEPLPDPPLFICHTICRSAGRMQKLPVEFQIAHRYEKRGMAVLAMRGKSWYLKPETQYLAEVGLLDAEQ
jgi:hypothetical protein